MNKYVYTRFIQHPRVKCFFARTPEPHLPGVDSEPARYYRKNRYGHKTRPYSFEILRINVCYTGTNVMPVSNDSDRFSSPARNSRIFNLRSVRFRASSLQEPLFLYGSSRRNVHRTENRPKRLHLPQPAYSPFFFFIARKTKNSDDEQ